MTTNKAVLGEGSITHLIGAQDEDIGNPKPNVKTGQALQIELARETVRDMQRHMRVGKAGIQLMTGKTPLLKYGTKTVPLRISPSSFRNEIYQQEGNQNPSWQFKGIISHTISAKEEYKKTTVGVDTALAQLQERMAVIAKEKEMNKTTFYDGVSKTTKKSVKAPVVVNGSPFARGPGKSTTASPAINATSTMSSTLQPSSANTVFSALQNAYKMVVLHLLALAPLTLPAIEEATGIPTDQCADVVMKFGVQSTKEAVAGQAKWMLKDRTYKSLDIWNFAYKKEEDRENAVENAIRAYDRLRLSRDDKAWDLLLPASQRGKGTVLSKLNTSQFGTTPVIRQQPTNGDVSDTQDSPKHTPASNETGSEPMAREKSLDSMAWKKTESEARLKSIMSKKPAKPSTPKMHPKNAAKKEGESARKDEDKKTTKKPAPKRKSGQADQPIDTVEAEVRSDSEDLAATVSAAAGERSSGNVGVVRKTEKKILPPKRNTDTKFKSAERIDDSDDEFSEVDQPAVKKDHEPKAKRPATNTAVSKAAAPSSATKKDFPNKDKPQKAVNAETTSHATPSGKRETPVERSSTSVSKNTTKKPDTAKNTDAGLAKKGSSNNDIKKKLAQPFDTTSSPKVLSQSPATKKKVTSTNVGLGINLGGSDGETLSTDPTKQKQTTAVSNTNAKKTNATPASVVPPTNAAKRPVVPAPQTKREAISTDSSANSWASSLSAKSTPMHRQSSSQSSVSIQEPEMPKARKRPAEAPADQKPPPGKKVKPNSAAPKLTSQVSSSPLSDPRSISTPSNDPEHNVNSTKLQKRSKMENSKIANVASSPSASIAEEDHEQTDDSRAVDPEMPNIASSPSAVVVEEDYTQTDDQAAVDLAKSELNLLREQLRAMWAAYIKLRVQIDKVKPNIPQEMADELETAAEEIRSMEAVIKPLAITNGDYEWSSGLPRGVELDPDDLEYCRTKLYSLHAKYNTLHDEIVAMDVQPVELRREARKMYKEVMELKRLVFPLSSWYPGR